MRCNGRAGCLASMNAVLSLAGFGAKCKTKEKRTMNSDKGSANVHRAERCSHDLETIQDIALAGLQDCQ